MNFISFSDSVSNVNLTKKMWLGHEFRKKKERRKKEKRGKKTFRTPPHTTVTVVQEKTQCFADNILKLNAAMHFSCMFNDPLKLWNTKLI